MIGFIKLAALSAALSYSTVIAYNLPVQKLEATVSSKYQDRVLAAKEAPAYAAGTVVQSVVETAGSVGRGDRLVTRFSQADHPSTIESREGMNTSVLTRVPQISIAQR
jgi:hypothetical protein